jgi:diguanylate cyclase (GGDEF)-like protein
MFDPVTRTLNHPVTLELVRREFARGERLRAAVSLILIRLDSVDKLQRQGGNAMLDGALEAAAQRFGKVVRPYDVLGRVGDAQFLLVLPGCEGGSAVQVAARLQYALSSKPITLAGEALRVTACFGVVSTTQRPGARMAHALHCADRTLQRATEEGRNRVRLAANAEWEASASGASSPAA